MLLCTVKSIPFSFDFKNPDWLNDFTTELSHLTLRALDQSLTTQSDSVEYRLFIKDLLRGLVNCEHRGLAKRQVTHFLYFVTLGE